MGRRGDLRIRQTFEPTRLGTETLRLAYDLVAPVRRAVIVREGESVLTDQELELKQNSGRQKQHRQVRRQ